MESLSGLKMKLKRQRVSSVLPEHHEVFNRMLGKDQPPPTPAQHPPILYLKNKQTKTSSDYTFPMEKNSLLLGAPSIPSGLSTDKGHRGHINDTGLG